MVIRSTPSLEQRLDQLATENGRTANDLAQEAVERYLGHIQGLTAEVREAEDEAEREGWLSSEEVWKRLEHRFPKSA